MEPIIVNYVLSLLHVLAAVIYWLIMNDLIKGDHVLAKALKSSISLFLLITVPNYWFDGLFHDPIYQVVLYTSSLWAIVGFIVFFCNFFRKTQVEY